jgi:disulfide oxidoreductase YuzD
VVQVEYFDVAEAEVQERFPQVIEEAQKRRLRYPLIAIDGQLRLQGGVQYYRVIRLVEEALKGSQS